MTFLKTSILLAAAVALTACTSADRFDNPDSSVDLGAGAATTPGALDPTSSAYFSAQIGDRVLFAVDESTLNAEARALLTEQAGWLNNNAQFTALIEGHADEQGTREYNLALGARRASAVQQFLISQGVAPNRLRTVTFGKERPLEICSEEACYAQNRRAVTVLRAGGTS
jgi:peptidoglycan-associated lipoprotein